MKKIFVSCGEVSGDIYAGDLVREILKINSEIEIYGMLGHEGEKAGGIAKWSYEELKLMGIFEILPAIPRILRLKNEITKEIIKSNPEAAILIDSPDFNLMLAKSLRKSGYKNKIISLIPPTVWAWRSGRIKNLKRDFDLCLPLFYFEHKFLLEHNVKSLWRSHPLVHDLKNVKLSDDFKRRFKDEKIIALMPGSRSYDINFHIEILLRTAKLLREKNYLPVFSVAKGLTKNLADKLKTRVKDLGFEIWEGEGRELMLGSCAVAGVSGTVAVEAMLLNKFMVVIYNMKKITHEILKRLVHVEKISIPNYLASSQVYPELICEEARPEKIVDELEKYLNDEKNKSEIDFRLNEAKKLMGNENAAEFWAESIMSMLK